jgi:predicted CXXCH cytochrome family protein
VHRAQGVALTRAPDAEQLCASCHGENPSRAGLGPGMTTHPTGKAGPPCLDCHRIHQAAGGRKLLGKAALEGRVCRQCHERNFSAARSAANHPVGPEKAGCLSCHRLHNAEKPGVRRGLLAAPWAEADALCRRCHAGLAGEGAGGEWNHPLDVKAAGDESALAARLARSGAFFSSGGRITCLSCHRPHAGRVGTPQLAAPREALCLHCHPAQNALDPERAALGVHPVSVKPRRARIDQSFLDGGGTTGPGGELTCSTCHRAHRGRPATPGLVLPRETYSCLLCHPRESSIASTPHGTARAPRAAGGAGTAGACGGCHGEHGWRVPLGEAAEGRTAIERLCAACHGAGEGGAPFGGATNHPLRAPPPGRGTSGLPLFRGDGRRNRRGQITCATCHDVHRSGRYGGFLRESLAAGSRGLCVGCHPAEAVVAGTRHDLAAARGSTCGPCHKVHDPLAVASWPGARGGGAPAAADLGDFCGDCHRPEGVAAGSAVAERFHPSGRRPGEKSGGRVGCRGCHDPHRWNPADAADRGSSAAGDGGTSFLLRAASGPADLCVGCHAAQAVIAGTPHDLTLPAVAGRAPLSANQLQRGLCDGCHRAHGAQPLAATPAQPQQPGAKAAPGTDPCEVCHAAGKIAAGAVVDGRGHPVGVRAGQDYGPDLPLFGATGRRQAGGSIACATCHDPHRWAPRGGSGAKAKAATSFLRLGADGYAPLCFPCHPEESLIVGTDHDLRVTAPAAVNLAGEDAETSGVCGACHALHRAPAARPLWNRGLGEGRDEGSRICSGCHRVGNDQGARVPPRAEPHLVNFPGRGLVSRLFRLTRTASAGSGGILLFAEDGSRAEQGHLRCASCHDVHRWEAGLTNPGPGVPAEGNLTNSFLRVRSTNLGGTLCAECHGESLVEHYRDYHFPDGR